MRLKQFRIGALLVLATAIGGCGVFEDTKVEEIYQNTTARYNGYFNASMLMQDVVENNRKAYKDNFTDILDVYQFPTQEMAKQNTPKCDKIIKKCTRVLQKRPETKWSDDCYFLMGKARFYKGSYSKAVQMLRYVSSKYKEKPTAFKAKVWVVHTYLQQGNITDGRAMLTNIQSQGKVPEDERYHLTLAEAAIAIEEGSLSKARERLEKAHPKVSNNSLQHRYRFIMGQLSQEMGDYHEAIKTYNKVLSQRTRYELAFHAKINKAACFQALADEAPRKVAKIKRDLKKMLKDDKNVDYKSRIYFELAQLSRETGDTDAFLKYLDKALRAEQASAKQQAIAYRSLARYHYNHDNFPKAKAYYDSTAGFITPQADGYLAFKRKKDILDELIRHKQTIRTQDSLQKMATWTKTEFKSHFQKLIKEAKQAKQKANQAKARRKRQRQLDRLRSQRRQDQQQGQTITDPQLSEGGGTWYFYNETSKGRGFPQFKQKWGNRPLQDFWRFRTQQVAFDDEQEEADTSQATAGKVADTNKQRLATEEVLKQDVIPENFKKLNSEQQAFFAQIPFNDRQLRLSKNKKQRARYQLGRIYYQDLEAYDQAIETLKRLNQDHPDHAYKPPSLYYLYRMFEEKDQTDTAERYKKQLIRNYPESEYAQILQRSRADRQDIRAENKALEQYYQKTYQAYQQAKCDTVRQREASADSLFEENYLAAKMTYLAILCEGKHEDTKTTFKQKLKDFLEKHEGERVANHAQQVYNYLASDGKLATSSGDRFPFNENLQKKHVYFLVLNLKTHKSRKVVQELSNYNKQYYEFLNLDLSTLMYSRNKQVLVVRDFEDKGQAMQYRQSLASDKDFLKKIGIKSPNHFVATQANYKQVLKERNLPVYAQFFETKYK